MARLTGARRGRRTLAAWLGAPLAWTLHLLASYVVVALACAAGGRRVTPALGAITAVCAILAIANGVVGYRRSRRARATTAEADETLMLVGVLAAPLFTVAIVLEGVVPAFLPPCPPG
jgi:hypothetical protein